MQDAVTPLSESEAVDLVKDVFASATERDIYTVSSICPVAKLCVRLFDCIYCANPQVCKICRETS